MNEMQGRAQKGREPGPVTFAVSDDRWLDQERDRAERAEEHRDEMLLDEALTDPPVHASAPAKALEMVLGQDDELPVEDQLADRLEIEAASRACPDDGQ